MGGVNYFLASKWFDIWVMSNWRDLLPMDCADITMICRCCPHRNDEHDMNCIECCPVSRAIEYAKGGTRETQYFIDHLRGLRGFA